MQRLLDIVNKNFSLQTDLSPIDNKNNSEEDDDSEVPGRKTQYRKLGTFINKATKSCKGDSLYICGTPGTGKTLTLTTLSKNLPKNKYRTIYINCMDFSQASKIYIEIYRRLSNLKSTKKGASESLELIESNFFYDYETDGDQELENLKKKEKTVILILDEVDVLIEKFSSILYRIFEWPTRDSSKLILFGIANDLGLVEKSLPRFAKIGMDIEVLHFEPYVESQILEIFQHRIKRVCKEYGIENEEQKQHLFEPETLEMISKRLASNRCDIRKAFDVIRRLVTLKFEQHIENADCNDSLEEDPNEVIDFEPNQYCFTMELVNEVISEFFESKVVTNMKSLPIHAQLILFSSFLTILNFETLYKSYKNHCSIISFTPMGKSDFSLSIDSIVSNGLMSMNQHKLESGRVIRLLYSKEELSMAFKDSIIFEPILQELNSQ
ncbi:hypothetical protein RB653_002540 [Dictyostelium firmibasis]|uniref:AAA+ ATPase domain-containing protein n=1 Tax=Dictyostelium firmibasis TaxID=79012 RepID=A0AAN7YVQ2_9MYCE